MDLSSRILPYAKLATLKAGYLAGQIEVTSRCFQMCRGCESWRDHKAGTHAGEWSLQQAVDFTRDLLGAFPNFEHLSLTGGDPQAWEELDTYVDWAARLAKVNKSPMTLQLNTALARPVSDVSAAVWRESVRDVRVSLDAATPATYTKIRGDRANTPGTILHRCKELAHPGLAFNVTAYPENVHELCDIVDLIQGACDLDQLKVRKVSVLAVIGNRSGDLIAREFWPKWLDFRQWLVLRQPSLSFQTSVGEDPAAVRAFASSQEAAAVPCYTGNLSFHVKANGDLYPCCLVGGEAIETREDMVIGNVHTNSLKFLYEKKWTAEPHYANPGKPCAAVCQWKQLQMNLAGHHAANAGPLSMP